MADLVSPAQWLPRRLAVRHAGRYAAKHRAPGMFTTAAVGIRSFSHVSVTHAIRRRTFPESQLVIRQLSGQIHL